MSAELLILYTCAMHIFKSAARRFQAGPAVYPPPNPAWDAEISLSSWNLHGGFPLCYSNPLTPRGWFLLRCWMTRG